MTGPVFTCIDWFCELCQIFFASKHASCLQDYSNTKWTLYSCHQCNELCSKELLRELGRKSCGCQHYLQLAEPAKIGKETMNLQSLKKKVAHVCTHSVVKLLIRLCPRPSDPYTIGKLKISASLCVVSLGCQTGQLLI
jgi:hypothetical protein